MQLVTGGDAAAGQAAAAKLLAELQDARAFKEGWVCYSIGPMFGDDGVFAEFGASVMSGALCAPQRRIPSRLPLHTSLCAASLQSSAAEEHRRRKRSPRAPRSKPWRRPQCGRMNGTPPWCLPPAACDARTPPAAGARPAPRRRRLPVRPRRSVWLGRVTSGRAAHLLRHFVRHASWRCPQTPRPSLPVHGCRQPYLTLLEPVPWRQAAAAAAAMAAAW